MENIKELFKAHFKENRKEIECYKNFGNHTYYAKRDKNKIRIYYGGGPQAPEGYKYVIILPEDTTMDCVDSKNIELEVGKQYKVCPFDEDLFMETYIRNPIMYDSKGTEIKENERYTILSNLVKGSYFTKKSEDLYEEYTDYIKHMFSYIIDNRYWDDNVVNLLFESNKNIITTIEAYSSDDAKRDLYDIISPFIIRNMESEYKKLHEDPFKNSLMIWVNGHINVFHKSGNTVRARLDDNSKDFILSILKNIDRSSIIFELAQSMMYQIKRNIMFKYTDPNINRWNRYDKFMIYITKDKVINFKGTLTDEDIIYNDCMINKKIRISDKNSSVKISDNNFYVEIYNINHKNLTEKIKDKPTRNDCIQLSNSYLNYLITQPMYTNYLIDFQNLIPKFNYDKLDEKRKTKLKNYLKNGVSQCDIVYDGVQVTIENIRLYGIILETKRIDEIQLAISDKPDFLSYKINDIIFNKVGNIYFLDKLKEYYFIEHIASLYDSDHLITPQLNKWLNTISNNEEYTIHNKTKLIPLNIHTDCTLTIKDGKIIDFVILPAE